MSTVYQSSSQSDTSSWMAPYYSVRFTCRSSKCQGKSASRGMGAPRETASGLHPGTVPVGESDQGQMPDPGVPNPTSGDTEDGSTSPEDVKKSECGSSQKVASAMSSQDSQPLQQLSRSCHETQFKAASYGALKHSSEWSMLGWICSSGTICSDGLRPSVNFTW